MEKVVQGCDVNPNQIKQWHDQLLEGATGVFSNRPTAEPETAIDVMTQRPAQSAHTAIMGSQLFNYPRVPAAGQEVSCIFPSRTRSFC